MKKLDQPYKKELNSTVFKRLHRKAVSKQEGACTYCPPHGGPDNSRLNGKRKPKPDVHKNKKRESIRKGAIEKVRRQVSPDQF